MSFTTLTVTASELGDVLDLTDRRIRQLAEEGVFQRESRGRYPLAASVQAYIAAQENDESDELRRERISLMKAQRRRLELDNEFRESTVDEIAWQEAVIAVLVSYWQTQELVVSSWLHDDLITRGITKDARIVAGTVHNWMIGLRARIEEDLMRAAQEARRQSITLKTYNDLTRMLTKTGGVNIVDAGTTEAD